MGKKIKKEIWILVKEKNIKKTIEFLEGLENEIEDLKIGEIYMTLATNSRSIQEIKQQGAWGVGKWVKNIGKKYVKAPITVTDEETLKKINRKIKKFATEAGIQER